MTSRRQTGMREYRLIEFFRNELRSLRDRCWPQSATGHYGKPSNTDTVVLVHGIFAHGIYTWGDFPRLLATDPDLPKLDYLIWCYPTGCSWGHTALKHEGENLVGGLKTRIRDQDDIFIVGHSMGGLVVLHGLVDRIIGSFAQEAPCKSVRWITLFASPLNGSALAGAVWRVVGLPLVILCIFHKHLRDLARGKHVDKLRVDVVHRIYKPDFEDSCHRRIPIRLVLGSRDRAVGKPNREFDYAMFRDPGPTRLVGSHSSIKLPEYWTDPRYRAFGDDLKDCQTQRFRKLCQRLMDIRNTTMVERERVMAEMFTRYGTMIRHRVVRFVRKQELFSKLEHSMLLLMAELGSVENLPPHVAADSAMDILQLRRRWWQ